MDPTWFLANLAWVVPSILLVSKILFRLVANNEFELADLGEVTLALPVDIAFLAVSFASAKAISSTDHRSALSWALSAGFLLVLGVLVTAMWRQSRRSWDKGETIRVVLLVVLNWIIALVPLVAVVRGLA